MTIQNHLWGTENFAKRYTPIHNDMSKHEDCRLKITVWLGKTFKGFTKLNPKSDYRKLSGDGFADRIIPLKDTVMQIM